MRLPVGSGFHAAITVDCGSKIYSVPSPVRMSVDRGIDIPEEYELLETPSRRGLPMRLAHQVSGGCRWRIWKAIQTAGTLVPEEGENVRWWESTDSVPRGSFALAVPPLRSLGGSALRGFDPSKWKHAPPRHRGTGEHSSESVNVGVAQSRC